MCKALKVHVCCHICGSCILETLPWIGKTTDMDKHRASPDLPVPYTALKFHLQFFHEIRSRVIWAFKLSLSRVEAGTDILGICWAHSFQTYFKNYSWKLKIPICNNYLLEKVHEIYLEKWGGALAWVGRSCILHEDGHKFNSMRKVGYRKTPYLNTWTAAVHL